MAPVCFRTVLSATLLVFALGANHADAQTVSASPKGAIGLGLVGAELGLTIPAVAGLDETWSLIVFPVVGAAGGAVAGHFLLDQASSPTGSVIALTAGLALVVPSVVLTLWATRYDPEDEDAIESGIEDDSEEGEAEANDEAAEPAQAEPATEEPVAIGGLLQWRAGTLRAGVPGFDIVATYSQREQVLLGMPNQTEFRLTMVAGTF